MSPTTARTVEDEAREKVMNFLADKKRPYPAEEIIAAILESSVGTFSFEVVRRAIVNLLDEGQLVLTEDRTVGLAA